MWPKLWHIHRLPEKLSADQCEARYPVKVWISGRVCSDTSVQTNTTAVRKLANETYALRAVSVECKPGLFGIKFDDQQGHFLPIWSPRLLQQWRIVASRVVAILRHWNTLESNTKTFIFTTCYLRSWEPLKHISDITYYFG